jgi:hypothetical protein
VLLIPGIGKSFLRNRDRVNVRDWPVASSAALQKCGRSRINSGQTAPSGLTGSAAFDPKPTPDLARDFRVHAVFLARLLFSYIVVKKCGDFFEGLLAFWRGRVSRILGVRHSFEHLEYRLHAGKT